MDESNEFGPMLEMFYKRRGWSQDEFAKRMDVKRQTIYRWIKQLALPSKETYYKMVPILELTKAQQEVLGRAYMKAHLEALLPLFPDNIINLQVLFPKPQSNLLPINQIPPYFQGRERDIQHITALAMRALREQRQYALLLYGFGGIGKTTLAYAIIDKLKALFSGHFVLLKMRGGPSSTNSDTPSNPMSHDEAMRYVVRQIAPDILLPDDEDLLHSVYINTLVGRNLIIFADDVRDAYQVRNLVPPEGNMLLITSRTRFIIDSGDAYQVTPLSDDNSKRMLMDVYPPLTPKQASALAIICGGLPLALHMIGMMLKTDITVDVEQLITVLSDERERLIQMHNESYPHLDIEPSLDFSYNLLDSLTKTIFSQISVFAGTFDLTAAKAIIDGGEYRGVSKLASSGIEGFLAYLCQRDLVQYDQSRYHQHDIVRAFGRLKLRDTNTSYKVHLKHAAYYHRLLVEADQSYEAGGDKQRLAIQLVIGEWQNIQAGQAWSVSETTFDAYWLCNEYPDAGAYILSLYQAPAERIKWRQQALVAARYLGDRQGEGLHWGNIGSAYFDMGNMPEARRAFLERLAISREIGKPQGESNALGNLGLVAYAEGKLLEALDYYQQQLHIAETVGFTRGAANGHGTIARTYCDCGDLIQARSHAQRQYDLGETMGEIRYQADACLTLGNIAWADHDFSLAETYYRQALNAAKQVEHHRVIADASWYLGKLLYAHKNTDQGLSTMRQALSYEKLNAQLKGTREQEFAQLTGEFL